MRLHCLALVLLCAAATSSGATIIGAPPPEYLGHDGKVVVVELPQRAVHHACLGMNARPARGHLAILGCAILRPGSCTIVVPLVGEGGVDARRRGAIERHERAHCAGWVHP